MDTTGLQNEFEPINAQFKGVLEITTSETELVQDDFIGVVFSGTIDDKETWRNLVTEAVSGSEPHLELVSFVKEYAYYRYKELNSSFANKITKDDIPKFCTRCKNEPFHDVGKLKGRMPSLIDTATWFYAVDSDWCLQLEMKDPFLGFDPLSKLSSNREELPELKVGCLLCPNCVKEQSRILDEILV
ncbi:hypothetical protein [Vibrio crassostreae]|uniref:hypothetical protein n=1 Tax=Vibrio crassostreae TaxID=246167 RepID=UPI001B3074E7|nr:hypothetical protein [Vibrio crassostreae]